MNATKQKRLILLTCIIIWYIIVFIFSNQNGEESSELSGRVAQIITNNIKGLSENQIELLAFMVRKCAHIFEYMIGTGLVLSYINTYEIKFSKKLILTFFIILFFAITDEVHQLFISERAGQIVDVGVDCIGFFLVAIIFSCYKFSFKKLK